MKKIVALLMILTLSLVLFAGCTAKEEPAVSTPPATETRTFTVGFDQDFPPYGYVGDNGEYTGFDLEMAAALCERLGWELKLQPINWDSKDMELESGAIDCIWNGFTINGREGKYAWTEAYMDNSQVFVVRADSDIKAIADLAGKSVATQADSSALAALKSEDNTDLVASFKELREFGEYNTAFMELESGANDAIAMDIGVAKFQIDGRDDLFVILDEVLMAEQYGIGFLLGNEALRDTVQAELKAMVADGTFAEISEKWFGYDVYAG